MYNILICDDEKDIVNALNIYLKAEGYQTFAAYNGRQALEVVEKENIHLILMDIMMPVLDGIGALAKLRENSNIPVILLTAKGEDTDKVLGLNIGADDYVVKPFNPVELLARVKAQLRRYMNLGGRNEQLNISVGGLTLDDNAKSVSLHGEPVNLTPTEYDILKLLMNDQGKVFSSADIYRQVWQADACGGDNTVAVHIRHLREKLEINPAEPRYLKVVWGKGYKIEKGTD